MCIDSNNYKKQNTKIHYSSITFNHFNLKNRKFWSVCFGKLIELSTCEKSKIAVKCKNYPFFHLQVSQNYCTNFLQTFWKGIIQKGKCLKLHNRNFRNRRKISSVPASIEHKQNKPPPCTNPHKHAHTHTSVHLLIDSTQFYWVPCKLICIWGMCMNMYISCGYNPVCEGICETKAKDKA